MYILITPTLFYLCLMFAFVTQLIIIIIINIYWLSYKGYSEPIYNKNIIYFIYLVYLF